MIMKQMMLKDPFFPVPCEGCAVCIAGIQLVGCTSCGTCLFEICKYDQMPVFVSALHLIRQIIETHAMST